jgi:hypothetical protein
MIELQTQLRRQKASFVVVALYFVDIFKNKKNEEFSFYGFSIFCVGTD